jgi:hypothetical protein
MVADYSKSTCKALSGTKATFGATFFIGVALIKYSPGEQLIGFGVAALGAAGWWVTGAFINEGCGGGAAGPSN